MTITRTNIMVGLGEAFVSRDAGLVLTCIGIGSCVAISVFDPLLRVGGMAHMVLPESDGKEIGFRAKYVDAGIPFLIEELLKHGANKSRMIAKMAGGARMFLVPGDNGRLNIGERNIAMTEQVLARHGIPIAAADVGGDCGRSVYLYVETGETVVKTVGGAARTL